MCAAPIAVRAEHDLVERVTRGDPHFDPLERARRRIDANPRAGARVSGWLRRGRRVEHHRSIAVVARATTGTLDAGFRERALEQDGVLGDTGTRRIASTTTAASATAAPRREPLLDELDDSPFRHTALAAIGGRFGPSRTQSSRE